MTEENIRIRIREELVAKRRLEADRLLFERSMLNDAVNRAYYSFFYVRKQCLTFQDRTRERIRVQYQSSD